MTSTVRPVGVGNIDAKIEMLQATFLTCIEKYHEPTAFVAQVDATIQALRNFTLTIQANKSSIPNFEAWYKPWQERMKNDTYLKWLAETRTSVVHKDILATTSNATVLLINDHTERITTKHFDILASTKVLIKNGVDFADKRPDMRHATGIIERHYLFSIENKNKNALDVLSAGLAFMKILHGDLASYIHGNKVITGKLPRIHDKFVYPADKLKITFKLRDGSVLNEERVSLSREEMVKTRDLAKERYGRLTPKHDLNSEDKREVLRAHFEIAKTIFKKDGHHITTVQLKSPKGSYMITPIFRDRAEKMLFIEKLAKEVRDEKICEIILTTESWLLNDVKKALKQIRAGKEVGALRNKLEVLEIFYLDNKGCLLVLSAPIIRAKESGSVKLGRGIIENIDPETYHLFYPVFNAWGLMGKTTLTYRGKK